MPIRLNNNLPTSYQEFIHLSRYSRWLEDKGRRETWTETIERYFNYFEEHLMEMHMHMINTGLGAARRQLCDCPSSLLPTLEF